MHLETLSPNALRKCSPQGSTFSTNGLLTQPTFLFTPKGLMYFRNILSVLDFEESIDEDDYRRRVKLRDALMHEFISVYGYFGFPMPDIRVPALFHQFLKYYQLTAEPMNVQLEHLRIQVLEMQSGRIAWSDFCLGAERLLELPASESAPERMISHMAALFPASRFAPSRNWSTYK